MIRLFATDLDGTLLNENHQVDTIIEETINQVYEHQRIFFLATGRSMYKNHVDDFKNVKGKYYCLSLNGALITDDKGCVLYKQVLDHDFFMNMLEKFPTLPFECLGMEKMYFRKTREQLYEDYQKLVKWSKFHQAYTFERFHENSVFGISNEQMKDIEILKVNCRILDPDLKCEFETFLHENSDKIVNAPFQEDFFELTDISVNKGVSIQRLAQKLNIQENEIAVYGDGLNDITMLEMFQHSYAPSNASNEVKEYAKHIIGECKDHAVCYHILDVLKKDVKM